MNEFLSQHGAEIALIIAVGGFFGIPMLALIWGDLVQNFRHDIPKAIDRFLNRRGL